jgi:hypothetical protein
MTLVPDVTTGFFIYQKKRRSFPLAPLFRKVRC